VSYILDALRKSEQERNSQPVYEINQPVKEVNEPKAARKKWLWIVPVLLAVNILLLLWPETTPDIDPSMTIITDQIPGTTDSLSKTVTETEQMEEPTKLDAKKTNIDIKPINSNLTPALLLQKPTGTQTTTQPVEQTQRYHRNPFAPMPGRIETKFEIAKTPGKKQPKTAQLLPTPNTEKLNRSLLNQALIEQLEPLREKQRTAQTDRFSFPVAKDTALTSSDISHTILPDMKGTQQYESASSTVDNQTSIPLLRELESVLQRDIPALNVSVHIYTDIPEQRMARINGTMTRQGQQMSNDLTLEEIRPDSLILSFRGEKFRLMR
jgi:hypothetical protein